MEADSRVGVARAGRQLPAPPAAEVERGAEHEVGVEAGQDNAASREQREAEAMAQAWNNTLDLCACASCRKHDVLLETYIVCDGCADADPAMVRVPAPSHAHAFVTHMVCAVTRTRLRHTHTPSRTHVVCTHVVCAVTRTRPQIHVCDE